MRHLPRFSILLVLLLFGTSCQSDDAFQDIVANTSEEQQEQVNDNNNEEEDNEEQTDNPSSTTSLTTFVFGHSLIVHDPPLIPTPSNETTVPHWMASLAQDAGFSYEIAGQYGFLPQHADLPPFSQWGFDLAQPAWDSDQESFADANFNSILLTAGNFIQYQPAFENYYNEDFSPVDATSTIFDWCEIQEPGITLYIYENWPDMAPYISGGNFPPSAQEFDNYNVYTQGDFHNWWLDYHDEVLLENPELDIKMIPVGPIISGLLTETPLQHISITDLYEDDAPHGRPTIYFLASLVTYMAMYGTQVSTEYQIPETVDPAVVENFGTTIDYIWNYLQAFTFEDGSSRVFIAEAD